MSLFLRELQYFTCPARETEGVDTDLPPVGKSVNLLPLES